MPPDMVLSENALIMLKIMREAIKRKLFPQPFTIEVIDTIMGALDLSKEEYQSVVELLKADVREKAVHRPNFGEINDLLNRFQ